ncbi:hypothetical protein [Rhizobium leguminosarum]|uniref:hypothetical protein n=1 Tax=Rhizobium leguminosarum TaxID=384 RepID=UPI0018D5595C|nr:hypothetical protein [Rhizobium leguminosarum]
MSENPESAFVAELIRAANQAQKLTEHEIKSLLFRAIVTARDLRETVGIPGSGTREDVIVGLGEVAMDISDTSAEARGKALLDAAGLLRGLRIVVQSGCSSDSLATRARTGRVNTAKTIVVFPRDSRAAFQFESIVVPYGLSFRGM